MRIRQMAFSSRLKAHRNLLTLETLRFIIEFLKDGNARQAAIRTGIPPTYAARQGQWLKKHHLVKQALEHDFDPNDLRDLDRHLKAIEQHIHSCRQILGLIDEDDAG